MINVVLLIQHITIKAFWNPEWIHNFTLPEVIILHCRKESTKEFVQFLVNISYNYGILQNGRNALEAILIAAKNYVGEDRQQDCNMLIQELLNFLDPNKGVAMHNNTGTIGFNFQDIPDSTFLKNLNFREFSLIKIFGHTGETIIKEFLERIERCDNELQKEIKDIDIRILLRNPQHSTGRRADGIHKTITHINRLRSREFNNIRVHFYQDLPTFRGFVCHRKDSTARMALISFYHFPRNETSKRFEQAIYIDENNTPKPNQMIEVFDSWFEHFWGKTRDQKIHTIIFDFDDTMANSHDIQIEAWVDVIKEARKTHDLDQADLSKNVWKDKLEQTHFCEDVWKHINNDEELRNIIRQKFFRFQHAKFIFEEIFTNLSEEMKDEIHQRRFELRQGKMKKVKLFRRCAKIIKKVANEYHLVIISATDEIMIRNRLEQKKYKKKHSNLSTYFLEIFGKKEPIFDWKNIERKSQLILKVINILGVPIERLVYVGDNNGDFKACKRIGIDFIEARLFGDIVHDAIGQKSLIKSDEDREFFTDWNEFTKALQQTEDKKHEY